MKTAKEMFEKLGYKEVKQAKNTQHLIEYSKTNKYKETRIITFHTLPKAVSKDLKVNETYEGCCIFVDELQAINKQVEELGWFDE